MGNFDKGALFIKDRVVGFVKALIDADFERCVDISKEIIGFGPGLTPAMDDFICGLMICITYMANYYGIDADRVRFLNQRIAVTLIGLRE